MQASKSFGVHTSTQRSSALGEHDALGERGTELGGTVSRFFASSE